MKEGHPSQTRRRGSSFGFSHDTGTNTNHHHRRIWHARCLLLGADITYGIAPVLARAANVAASELAGLEEVQ